jgi:phospholipase C
LILDHQRRAANLAHYSEIKHFFDDVRDESTFPDFVLIEPKYSGQDQNDDHPPHNVFKGEKLVADVYNAIRSYDDLWETTLLVVVFDEHGGFYDHVSPPAAIPPDDHKEEYTFDRLGVRVPALLISPWVERRVEHTPFDHTSLLKYLIDKWSLNPLGKRTDAANSIGVALTGALRTDTIGFVRVPYTDLLPPKPDLEREYDSKHYRALQAFAAYLSSIDDQAGTDVVEAAAAGAGLLIQLKHTLGSRLTAMGAYLTKDMQVFRENEATAAQDVIRRLIDKPTSGLAKGQGSGVG